MKVARTCVVQGEEEAMTLRKLLDALDIVAAEAPEEARVKVFTDAVAQSSIFGPFFNMSFGKDEKATWLVGARWDETVGEDKPAPAPAAAAEEAAK